jgi:hypothetical protein
MDLVPQKQLEFTKKYLEVIRNNQLDSLQKVLGSNLVGVIDESVLESLTIYFPPQENPINVIIVGSNNIEYGDSSTTEITLQYEFRDSFVLGDLFLISKNDKISIAGIHITPIPESVETANKFTFENRSFIHYLFLVLGTISTIFILFSFVICLKSKIKKKWLWVLFILFGFGRVMLNWTTGKIAFSIISFQFLGFGVTAAGLYAPWIVSLSFPFGAVIFLFKKRKLIENYLTDQEVI